MVGQESGLKGGHEGSSISNPIDNPTKWQKDVLQIIEEQKNQKQEIRGLFDGMFDGMFDEETLKNTPQLTVDKLLWEGI